MKISVNLNGFKKQLKDNEKVIAAVFDDAYDFFVKTTPIGNPSN